MLGVATSGAKPAAILVKGAAALVAGAMSMAAGEYVSVSSQADAEAADRARETRELQNDPAPELNELTGIYQRRGTDAALARPVAEPPASARSRWRSRVRSVRCSAPPADPLPVVRARTALSFA